MPSSSLVSKTALMVEPYSDDPSTRGAMTIGARQLERIKQAHREGIQVMAHSTSDGTTRKLLDAIEQARVNDPNPSLRHHIGHLLTVTKEDIPRFKELNVIAEFSPIWFYPTPMGELASKYYGVERYARWQPIKEFIDAGVTVSVGSDWPAGTPDADPWKGLEGMITRIDPKTNSGDKLGEGVSLKTAIKILTINGAIAMMHEDKTGSIDAGKLADFIILDQNLFDLEEAGRVDRISETHVLKTIFEGKVVFDRVAAINALEVVEVKITNSDLDNAVDAAELNLLIEKDVASISTCRCFPGAHRPIGPGADSAPDGVNKAFDSLFEEGYRFARPARQVKWKGKDTFWIQWTLKDYQTAVLWAFDPEAGKAVEVLQVREK
jgi:hypothetical protein